MKLFKKIILILLIINLNAFGNDTVKNLQGQIKKIDNKIDEKNKRIKSIDSEKIEITNQIKKIEKDISEIEKDMDRIRIEMNSVNKNIDYGEKSLQFSANALDVKKMEYRAKLLAWNRNADLNGTLSQNSMAKRTFSRMLYGDLESMEHIKNVQNDIEKVKVNIQSEKRKLSNLQRKLDGNRRSIERKISEKNTLISRLNNEKKTHVRTISQLEKEKKAIAAQIEKIIRERAKPTKHIKLDSALLKLGKLAQPVPGRIIIRFHEKKEDHVVSNGIEILSQLGVKVKAASQGKVIYSDKLQGLNNVVMIDYGYNVIGVYGNLMMPNVRLNQQVRKGEEIGILGMSEGKPILYYEVRFNLKPINPELLF